ncbi:MAG: hypothetical protein WD825_00575 [Gemmatimonadaceae bacterium]
MALCITIAGCAGYTRESLRPIPDHQTASAASLDVRGTEEAARRIASDQQMAIIVEVVRRFYRPLMGQARWIDPQPLAHRRTQSADSLIPADEDWAIAIVSSVALRRVCPLTEANAQCSGHPGGVLRFSAPYSTGDDSAVLYARYTPVRIGAASETEFRMVRRGGVWSIASKGAVAGSSPAAPSVSSAATSFDRLLAADRMFAQSALGKDFASGIASMFAWDVIMQSAGGHVRGAAAAIEALRRIADSDAVARAEWHAVGGSTSSDGMQGFTFGYVTLGGVDRRKYLAYWRNQANGWRVAAYKVVRSAPGNPSLAMLPMSIPTPGLPSTDSATTHRYGNELRAAEIAFSDDAGPMGLGPAFQKWGAPDAVFTGGAAHVEFVRGPEAIAKSVSAGGARNTVITWAPTDVIVASTGDLGVSIGTIRITSPPTAEKAAETVEVPFFTVWKRATPRDVWRYVAE